MIYFTRPFKIYLPFLAVLLTSVLLFQSCKENLLLNTPLSVLIETPREAYVSALASNGLANSQMAKAWQRAGAKAFEDSILIEAPFQEIGYFQGAVPAAVAYQIHLQEGEQLEIGLTSTPDSVLFFMDIFQIEATDSTINYQPVFQAENYQTDSLVYEVKSTATYLLRLQPELLASCRYTLQLIVQPVYGVFPVSGKGNRDIWSLFGAPRDGGKREHKGIDIFARRGTPVVAAVDGVVRRVRNKGLGGKQVWLFDQGRSQSLYYAHLDSQLVREDQLVLAGDTLGLVGNTGNARNTRPHLHFGIYQRGSGALDPHPFVALQTQKSPAIKVDTARLGEHLRVKRSNVRLRSTPKSKSIVLATLDRYLPLEIVGATKAWYRVRHPNGQLGYLLPNNLEPLDRFIKKITLKDATELLHSPHPEAAPIAAVSSETEVAVIGRDGPYQLVRDMEGMMGWVPLAEK